MVQRGFRSSSGRPTLKNGIRSSAVIRLREYVKRFRGNNARQPERRVTRPALLNNSSTRFRIVQACVLFFFAVIALRLVQVQIVNSGTYKDIAQKQYRSQLPLPASRGMLYDRKENLIASNSMFVSFAADPKLAVEDARAIAGKFSVLFGKPKKYYLDKLETDSRFVWLERQVSPEYLKRIDLKKLDGIVVRNEPKRLYHNDQAAGQLVGFTDVDNKGLAGMELEFNDILRGTDGYVIFQRDGRGLARPSVDYPRVEPVNGHSVVLTIDMEFQSIAEKELQKGVQQNNADRGIVIMMQPKTGEILAIGQYPTIDPNRFGKYDLQDQKLRAITDVFEPGSMFKVVTASAALEAHLVKPDQKFFAENGKYIVPGRPKPIEDTHPHGWITFQEGMAFSSNIVMAKISDIVGSERFYKMARDYGFGIATNIEYPGEVKGSLKKPIEWSGTTLNSMAYGYEVGVTPLQMAAAYCAVANGGILMKPMLVKKEVDATGETVKEYLPQQLRRVISASTAATLKNFFEDVVEIGTGKPTKIPGVKIAGKTGTSRKYVDGHYEQGSYTASFVGFFPADDPQLVCLVMMDNPRGAAYYGGTVSAPVFREIAQHVLNTSEMFAPAVASKSDVIKNKEDRQQSASGQKEDAAPLSAKLGYADLVPDVRGFSVRRAVNILTMRKLQPVINGTGTVMNQSPHAGQPAKPGMKIVLDCQPKSLTVLNLH
jgi:cell division protein FtsI (penicillin-binding protein 3)